MTRKPPPFQNIDRMKPRSQRPRPGEEAPSGVLSMHPEVHITAEEPSSQVDHLVGTEGCYRHHSLKVDD